MGFLCHWTTKTGFLCAALPVVMVLLARISLRICARFALFLYVSTILFPLTYGERCSSTDTTLKSSTRNESDLARVFSPIRATRPQVLCASLIPRLQPRDP